MFYTHHNMPTFAASWQKLALTSPTGGGRSVGIVRSRTKATEFSLVYTHHNIQLLCIYYEKLCTNRHVLNKCNIHLCSILRTALTINKTAQTDRGMSLGWWHSSLYGSVM